jgi:hypothetical protein
MQVEITVKVNGVLVKQHVEQVEGTLEQMEEKIHALSKSVANETLQASVDAVVAPRPLFRRRSGGGVTKDIAGATSSGSTG